MTTIAYDGKTLAADTLVTSGSLAFGHTRKLHKLTDGRHVALCGNMALEPEILAWLNGKGEKPVLDADEEIGGLLVDKKGNAFEVSGSLRLHPACVPWAGGSGEHIALAAMALGKTAVEAVALACKMDVKTREPIDSVRICG